MQRSCNVFPSHSTNHGRHIVITGLHLKNLSHGEFETFAKVTQLANIRFGVPVPSYLWLCFLAFSIIMWSFSFVHLFTFPSKRKSCWDLWLCFQSWLHPWECVSEFCNQGTKDVLGILMQFQIKLKKRCELQLERLFQGVGIFFFFFSGWIRKLSSLGRQHFRAWCSLVPATDERQMVIFLRIHK